MTAPAPPEPPIEGDSTLDGAGVFSSYEDLGKALDGGDEFEVFFAGAAVALDTLGTIVDPFGSLFSAGIGWLFEHLAFLKEPLDALGGSPDDVEAQARSWHQVSLGLFGAATAQHRLTDPVGWTGEACDAYRRAAQLRTEQLAQLAQGADAFAVVLLKAGVAVGTVRSIVRDTIADFIGGVIGKLVGGALLAWLTGGVSLGVAIGWIVSDALALALRIAARIAHLLSTLDELLTGSRIGWLVELGKQETTADLEEPPGGS